MIHLIAFFVPPLYFLLKGKWVRFILYGILFVLALACIFSVVGAIIGVPLWLIMSSTAIWDLRKRMVDEQTTMLAKKMADAMRTHPGENS